MRNMNTHTYQIASFCTILQSSQSTSNTYTHNSDYASQPIKGRVTVVGGLASL